MHAEFIAYAGDCRVRGTIDREHGVRLSDILNAVDDITLRDAELTSHADGHVVHLDEVTLGRDELYAVEAVGARGEVARRLHTVKHRLQIRLGPYVVLGYLHSLPGNEPLVSIGKRAPMIPLTSATIAFSDGPTIDAHDVEALIINRAMVDWVRPGETDLSAFGLRLPESPFRNALG